MNLKIYTYIDREYMVTLNKNIIDINLNQKSILYKYSNGKKDGLIFNYKKGFDIKQKKALKSDFRIKFYINQFP